MAKKLKEATTSADVKGYLSNKKKKSSKKKKRDIPWYMEPMEEMHHLVKESLLNHKKMILEKRFVDDPEEHIKSLDREIEKLQLDLDQDPGDRLAARRIEQFQAQKERAKKAAKLGGKDWREYLSDPEGYKAQKEKEAGRKGSFVAAEKGGKYSDFAQSVINKYETGPAPVDKEKVTASILKLMKHYTGALPTDKTKKEKIENWIENTLVGKYKGNIEDYIKTQKNYPLFKSAQGAEKGKMKPKSSQSKRSAKTPVDFAAEPLPGEPSLSKLYSKLSKEPEHQEFPFPKPKPGDLGPGKILNKVYKKIVDGVIDPEDLDKVDWRKIGVDPSSASFTQFEKAVGEYLRGIYKKQGFDVDSPDIKKLQSKTAAYGPALTFAMSKVLGIPKDKVEDEVEGLSKGEFEKAEEKALEMLKTSFPGEYKREMEMREKRKAAFAEPKMDDDPVLRDMESMVTKKIGPLSKLDPEIDKLKEKNPVAYKSMIQKLYTRIADEEFAPPPKKEKEDYFKSIKAMDKLIAAKKGPQKGKSTKADRRAFARSFTSPRDPEQLAQRRELEPKFKASAMSFDDMKKREKEQRLELIKQRHKEMQKRMGMGESKMSIKKVFKEYQESLEEEFENAYELEADAKEENWEESKPEAAENWTKKLSLEAVMLKNGKPKKTQQEKKQGLTDVNTVDGWNKGNPPLDWLIVNSKAGKVGKDVEPYEVQNERDKIKPWHEDK